MWIQASGSKSTANKKLYVKYSPNIWVHILEEIVYGLTTPPLF